MSLEENKQLVRRFFEAINYDGNLSVLDDVCTAGYIHRVGGEEQSLTWLKDIVFAALRKGMYVIVTCQRLVDTLQAITVHIE
jgi:hypothetical protein